MRKKQSVLSAMLFSTIVMAQDSATEAEGTVISNETWYESPWLWIVGAAMFIVLLVALTKGKRD